MQFVRNLILPFLAPFAPGWAFKKIKTDMSALAGALLAGLAVVCLVRLAVFVPHEKSPDLSRVYDLLFFSLAFAARVFLSAGVLWLIFRFWFKKKLSLIALLSGVSLCFLPLAAIIATDTMYLPTGTLALIALAAEGWHLAVLGVALSRMSALPFSKSLMASAVSLVLMLLMFDDVWGLARLLP